MKPMLILIAALLLCGCAPTEDKQVATKAPDTKADVDAVNKVRDDFLAAFNAGDATRFADLYADDAVQMPGDGSPTIKGRSAIVERNKGLFDQFNARITITPSRNQISGDLAYDEGTYTLEITPKKAGSKPMSEEGRYLIVLRREAGGWKVIEDIDNVIKAASPPPASKK